MVDEPTVEDAISILRGLKERYEVFHGVKITDGALVAAATLSNRYISDRFLGSTYTLQDVAEIEAIGTETARFVGALIRRFLWRCDYLWKPGFDLPPYTVDPGSSCCIHDWAAVAPAIDPLTATDVRKELCRVDCSGGMADGQMVIDRRGYYLEPNASIVYDMDEKRCKELLKSLLAKK